MVSKDPETDPLEVPRAKRGASKKRGKLFQYDWLNEPEYKPWLRPVPGDETKFYCLFCRHAYNGGKSEIERHYNARKHLEKAYKKRPKGKQEVVNIMSAVQAVRKPPESDVSFVNTIHTAEIRLAAYFTEHNIPGHLVQQLVDLLKDVLPDSVILKRMKLGRRKFSKILTQVLGRYEKEKVVDSIRTDKFSVFVSESMDALNNSWFTFLVKYIDMATSETRCELLDLVRLNSKESEDTEAMARFENLLSEKLIPSGNLVGIACSNFAQMGDRIQWLYAKLLDANPNLFRMDCVCHAANLASSNAMKVLSHDCEELVKLLATFIKNSTKHAKHLAEFLHAAENKLKNGAKFPQNRWCLFYECVIKLVSSWDDIETFLDHDLDSNAKNKSAEALLTLIRSIEVKATFLFLKHQLAFFKHFTDIFQKKNTTVVYKVHQEANALLRKIAAQFLKPHVVANMAQFRDIDFRSPVNQMDLSVIQLGTECTTFLQKKTGKLLFNGRKMTEFRKECKAFLIMACEEINKRLPMADPVLSKMYIFDPSFSLNDSDRDASFEDLLYLAKMFNVCDDEDGLQMEWNILYYSIDAEVKASLVKLDFDKMWIQIANLRDKNTGAPIFPQLLRLIKVVRILPHSTVDSEFTFAMVANTKAQRRLNGSTLNAICMIRTNLKNRGETSRTMPVEQRHLELMTSANLYPENNAAAAKRPKKTPVRPAKKIKKEVKSEDESEDEEEECIITGDV